MKILKQTIFSIALIGFLFSINIFAQEREIVALSKEVAAVLKTGNAKALAAYISPAKGLHISPYSNFENDSVKFTKYSVERLGVTRKLYNWGAYDGSGEPIKLTFPQYHKKFIFNRDYTKAPQISYNQILQTGNTLVDIEKYFPKAKFVDYYFPEGADGNEMGWSSLRLIFEKLENKWYLVGIGHGQWTI